MPTAPTTPTAARLRADSSATASPGPGGPPASPGGSTASANTPSVSPPLTSGPARHSARLGQAVLARVVASGLLGCAVPKALGGRGGTLAALAAGARALAADDAAAGWVLWAQRLAIEALVHSSNLGLRDYLLPDLLSGERAGTLPLPPWPGAADGLPGLTEVLARLGANVASQPLVAQPEPQGLRLYGHWPCVPNLQWQGHVLIAPVACAAAAAAHWVLLRGEEDGLHTGIDLDTPAPRGSRCAALTLDGVFFRADEALAGPELPAQLQATAQALAAGLLAG